MHVKSKQGKIFFAESGGLTPASVFCLLAGPLIFSGQYTYGVVMIVLGIVWALNTAMQNIGDEDKLEIRYNALSSEELMADLEHLEERQQNEEAQSQEKRIRYLEGMSSLARKYNQQRESELAMWCQQIAFKTLGLYPEDDEIVAGSISLLALVAQDCQTRKRYKYQTDDYSLQCPIQGLQKALERAKEEADESKEAILAEILRKGCLFLGAVCNEDKDLGIALSILQQGGLKLILDAANWFRFHEDVSNWALWAIFTLAFDNVIIKTEFVRLQGIQTVCELMQNNPLSLEVNRHGVAILFDLLRENYNVDNTVKWDPWEIRKIALASGLHKVVLSAMNEFSDSVDIMMMGQEMLIWTGFQGDVPVYQQL